MQSDLSRRGFLHTLGAAAMLSSARPAGAMHAEIEVRRDALRMPPESSNTPEICLGFYGPADDASMRRVKQIGVDHVLTGGPGIPWEEAEIRSRIERFAAGGLTLCNMMISGFDDVIWGRPGADAQISHVITSIRAAGKAGLPTGRPVTMKS